MDHNDGEGLEGEGEEVDEHRVLARGHDVDLVRDLLERHQLLLLFTTRLRINRLLNYVNFEEK